MFDQVSLHEISFFALSPTIHFTTRKRGRVMYSEKMQAHFGKVLIVKSLKPIHNCLVRSAVCVRTWCSKCACFGRRAGIYGHRSQFIIFSIDRFDETSAGSSRWGIGIYWRICQLLVGWKALNLIIRTAWIIECVFIAAHHSSIFNHSSVEIRVQ